MRRVVRRYDLVAVLLGGDARKESGTHAELLRQQPEEGLPRLFRRIEAAPRELGETTEISRATYVFRHQDLLPTSVTVLIGTRDLVQL